MLASIDFQEFHALQQVQIMQTLILVLQVGLLQCFQFIFGLTLFSFLN